MVKTSTYYYYYTLRYFHYTEDKIKQSICISTFKSRSIHYTPLLYAIHHYLVFIKTSLYPLYSTHIFFFRNVNKNRFKSEANVTIRQNLLKYSLGYYTLLQFQTKFNGQRHGDNKLHCRSINTDSFFHFHVLIFHLPIPWVPHLFSLSFFNRTGKRSMALSYCNQEKNCRDKRNCYRYDTCLIALISLCK